jgi:hypothetical protein
VYQPSGPGSIPGMSRSESAITRGKTQIMLLPHTMNYMLNQIKEFSSDQENYLKRLCKSIPVLSAKAYFHQFLKYLPPLMISIFI